jgi:monoamine oxidase
MALSRRDFLLRVGQAGGFSAAFLTMQSLGLLPAVAQEKFTLAVPPNTGKGVKVAILGGGIAGLVAAYEMRALGFDCTVLEARARPGGRNWTVRGGDTIAFTDGSTQHCTFDPGNYQNVGPARLPSIHRNMLGYCRKLGVELQVEVNTSRSTLLQNDAVNGGRPMVQRQVVNDTRGHVSELLAKCLAKGALDQDMTPSDRDRMLSFLRLYGSLDNAGKYSGSDGAGYSTEPGAGDQAGTLSQPVDMHTLLAAEFWNGILFEDRFDMQATMFQPVGGMDRIPYAFAKALGDTVQYNSPVTEIRRTAKGVRIGYKSSGEPRSLEADFCFCALPLTILKRTPNDFSAPYRQVIEQCAYDGAYKIAWESRRFWEQDHNIYGGLEFLATGCTPVWFPSANLFSERGVLVSGYSVESSLPEFAAFTLDQKFAASRHSIERLHPGHGRELEKPIYVGWARVPWNEGSWIGSYGPGQTRATLGSPASTSVSPGYETLLAPDGPIYFIGDHVSHIVAWQEGAALSSLRAIQLLADRLRASRT